VLIAALAGPAMRAQGVQSFQSIRLFNPATPTQGVTLAPPAGITSYTLTFPATAPVAGTALVSTGAGTTAWTTVPTTVSTLNSNRILVSSAGSITEVPALTNGQILIGSTGLAPVAATITAGSGITVTNAAGSITIAASGGLPTGTTNNATLRYNTATSAWTENTNVLGGTDGSLTLGGALGGGTSTATPVSIGLGSSYASDLNPLKAKLILYNDLSNNVIGMGVSLSSFNFFVNSASQFSWRSGSGATPTEIMSLSSSRLTLPSTTDLTIKGVSYTWPTANGAAGTVLTNNGSGTLTWSAASGSGWGLTGNAGTNATNNYIGTTDNVDFVVRTNNVERMRVLSGGNVGIGTTAPAAPLEVRRTVTAATEQTFISLYAVGDQQNHGSTIDFRNDGGGYYASIAGLDDANNDGRLELRVSGNSAINGSRLTSSDARLTIKRTGFVGIGTTAPSQLLTVTNGNVYLDNSGTAGELRFREPSASGANYTAFRAGAQAADLTYTLPLAAPTAGQLLSSDASGNLSWTSAGASGWGLTGNASTNATTNFIGTTDNVDFVVRTFNTERMRVLGGGNVTLGGALGTGSSTATPVTLSLGSTFASSVTASQAKLRIFENSSGSDIYGLGVSSSQLNYFAPTGATHRWYIGDAQMMSLSSTAATKLTVTNGNIYLDNTGTAGELRFREPSASGANYTAFRAGAQAADLTYTLPLTAPTAGQILSSDASGNLSWASAASAAWALSGSDYSAGSYTPTLNALTYQFGHGDKGSWVGTRNAQTLWFGVNSTYRAAIAADGTFTMSGPLVINNLSSAAGTTLPAGYDRILIGNSSGQIEEVSFTTFADATNTGWGINGNTTAAGTYAPSLNGSTVQFVNGDRGPWVGTRNAQPLWFATNNVYRAQLAVDGTFTMSGPLVINNLSSTAGATLPAGYDRILIGNSSGQIEEVSFTTFADATNTGWGINGNTTAAGTYAPSLNGSTVQFVNGDRGPWVGTRNAQPLWFGTNNVYRAQLAVDGTFTMSGPLVIDNLNSTASATISAGYDRVLVANNSGRVEEVSFSTFANASASSWGTSGNEPAAGTYSPSLGGNTTQFVSGDRGSWIGTRNARDLWFGTNNVYRAVITSTGELALSGQAQFAAGTAAAPSVSREGDTDNGMFFPAANTLAFSTGATERMRITDIGRVGIGNAAPAYVLDVTGDINSSTNVRAAGTALTSDLRLKRNIVDIDSALDIVERLVPVRYEKKSTIADSVYQWKQMGFIAQDLQEVLPDLVHVGRDADSTLSVDYTSLVALLTGAIKEQQTIIQDQTQYIRILRAQIDAIEERLKSLEQRR
jgi:hypothetical protein